MVASTHNMHHPTSATQTENVVDRDLASRSSVGAAAAFAASMARFAASGFKTVDAALHDIRTSQCQRCEHRRGSQCALCRCFVDKKAWLPHEDCPIGRWPG
jgi:hypothetical protein